MKKLLLLFFLILPAFANSQTVVTVAESGGDYTSIQAAITGTTGSTSGGLQIKVSGTWAASATDTTAINVTGYTGNTSLANGIWIYAATDGAFHDNPGNLPGTHHRLASTSTPVILVSEEFVTIQGLWVQGLNTDTYTSYIVQVGAANVIVRDCVVFPGVGANNGDWRGISNVFVNDAKFINNIIFGMSGNSIWVLGTARLYGNTIIGGNYGINSNNTGQAIGINNLVQSTVTGDYALVDGTGSATNVDDDGSGDITGNVTFVSEVSPFNYRLASGDSVAKDAGTDNSANTLAVDFEYESRTTWDVGADEYVSEENTPTPENTPTATNTATATNTPTNTNTPTVTPTATNTPTINDMYIDYDAGADTNSGATEAQAWKHAPGDPLASGTPAAINLAAGNIVHLKGGVDYKGSIEIDGSGGEGAFIRIVGNDWSGTGKNARIDGADTLPDAWVLSASANIYFVTPPSNFNFRKRIFENDQMNYWSIEPDPEDMWNPRDNDNYWPIEISSSTKELTLTAITDPDILGQYDNPNFFDNSCVLVWNAPDDIRISQITAFDPATDTITYDEIEGTLYNDRDMYYALLNHPTFIDTQGEFAFDGTFIYAWPFNVASTIYAGTREIGIETSDRSYIQIAGVDFTRITNDGFLDYNLGVALNSINGGEIHLSSSTITNMGNTRRSFAVNFQNLATATVNDSTLVLGEYVVGLYAAGATDITFKNTEVDRMTAQGVWFQNVTRGLINNVIVTGPMSDHANGISVYNNSDDAIIANSRIWNVYHGLTFQDTSNILFYRNIIDSTNVFTVVNEWSGSSAGDFYYLNNTFIQSEGNAALNVGYGSVGAATHTIINNIIDGLIDVGGTAAYLYDYNLYTNNSWQQTGTLPYGEHDALDTNLTSIFVNVPEESYGLKEGSAARGMASTIQAASVPAFVSTSFPSFYSTMNLTPSDVGAMEYTVDNNIIYVDSVSGDDSSVSPYTPETALKTITAMNARAEIGSGSEIRFQGTFRQEKINIAAGVHAQNLIFTSYGTGAEIKGSTDLVDCDWTAGTLSNSYYLVNSGSTVPSITAPLDLFFNETQRGLRDRPIGTEYAWGYSDTIGGVTKYEDFEAFVTTDYDTRTGTVTDYGDVAGFGENIYVMDLSERLRKNSVNYKSMRMTFDWRISSASTPSEGARVQLVNLTNTTDWTGSTSLRVTGIYSSGVFYINLDFGATYATTYALAFDTWYRIDLICDAIAGTASLYVDNGLVESLSSLTTANYINLWEVGQMNVEATQYTTWIDNLYIADAEWQRLPFETIWVHTLTGDPDTNGVTLEAPFTVDDLFSQASDESGYVINHLTFLHSGRHGFNSAAYPGNNLIENCTFSLNLKHGVIITSNTGAIPSVNNLIRYVTADLNGETGLSYGQYVQNSTITYCETDRNSQTDEADTAGIRIVPGGGLGNTWWANKDLWITHNIVSNTGKDATGTGEYGHQTLTNGLWADTIIDSTITFNISYNNMGAGDYVECSSETLTAWNLSYGNEYGFRADTAKVSPMGNEQNRITNNTFANNSIAGILNAGKANDQTFISVSNNYFANNIVYGNPISLWVRYGGQNTQAADGWGSGNEYLNNSFGAETTGFLRILNTTYDTYAAFNAAFDPDLTGITIDPELVNPVASNFILSVTSPVIDQGIDHDWQGSVDLLANLIIIPVDYGSYENQEPTYTPTPTATPTVTSTPTATNTPTVTPTFIGNPIMDQRIKDRRRNNTKEQ